MGNFFWRPTVRNSNNDVFHLVFTFFLVGTVAYSVRFEKDYITMEDLEEFSKSTNIKMEDLIDIEKVKS